MSWRLSAAANMWIRISTTFEPRSGSKPRILRTRRSIGSWPSPLGIDVLPDRSIRFTKCSDMHFPRRDVSQSAAVVVLAPALVGPFVASARQNQEQESRMRSRHLMTLRLDTAATEDIGTTPRGTLSIFPVTRSSSDGNRLRGRVLAGGGDWVTTRADGV